MDSGKSSNKKLCILICRMFESTCSWILSYVHQSLLIMYALQGLYMELDMWETSDICIICLLCYCLDFIHAVLLFHVLISWARHRKRVLVARCLIVSLEHLA
jgi:hypothetical protein